MRALPRRVTLVEQTVKFLRHELQTGRWPDQLPGEFPLCDLLQVSRSTLRLALDALRREGLVRVARGRRRRVLPRDKRTRHRPTRTIGVISSLPLSEDYSTRSIVIFDELRRLLQQGGFELQLRIVPQLRKSTVQRRLARLTELSDAACWILASCSIEVQEWFVRYRGPTLVRGTCHEGVDLPFIRSDAGAACRHAVGLLHAQGHRQMGLLLRPTAHAGTLELEQAMYQTCDRFGVSKPYVRYHEGSAELLGPTVSAMMKANLRTTGLIVAMPSDALSVYCHAIRRGYRVPGDISIIAIFDDLFLPKITPALSRYSFNCENFARRMARMAIKMAESGTRPQSVSIFPDFIPGETIGPPQVKAR